MKDMVLLIDSNVFLDVFLNRIDFLADSKKVIDYCMCLKKKCFIAAHSITNMYYIMRKEMNDELRRKILLSLFTYFNISSIDAPKLISALNRDDFRDFEDCLQNECAIEEQVDCIITRNKKDFEGANVSVYTPTEFAALMKL